MMLSIVIPSVGDRVLQRTVDDIRMKAAGPIEVVVVLDGVDVVVVGADKVLRNRRRAGMRTSVNRGVAASSGEYVMKTDEHCMFSPGFDLALLTRVEHNWLVVPRRYKLDVDAWELCDEPPIDYDRLVLDRPHKIGGVYWTQRAMRRADVMIDETMVHQGSCYLMARGHWDWLGGLQVEGYGEFAQEAIETSLKTWLGGGKVMINKMAWYAHKHRRFKRTVHVSSAVIDPGNRYSMDFWLNDRPFPGRVHDLRWLMRRFGLQGRMPTYDTAVLAANL